MVALGASALLCFLLAMLLSTSFRGFIDFMRTSLVFPKEVVNKLMLARSCTYAFDGFILLNLLVCGGIILSSEYFPPILLCFVYFFMGSVLLAAVLESDA